MQKEYNKLTQRLLAEGYTAENYPPWVKVAGGQFGTGNKLDNLYGGFEYTRAYADERIYVAPCGLFCKGKTTFDMTYTEEWSHENDNPIIHCPFHFQGMGCLAKNKNFLGRKDDFCVVKPTDREYNPDKSVEEIQKCYDRHKERERQKYLEEHPRHCPNHLKWNQELGKWEFKYIPSHCISHGCCGGRNCPVLGRELTKDKGNIFFDIEAEYPDPTKKGTFWDGERIKEVITGLQYFDKPENLDVCKAVLKVEKEYILYLIKTNKLPKLFGAWTIFQAELGKIDFKWRVVNMRAEKRKARDLDQDLQDIENGVIVRDARKEAKEEEKRKKEHREELRAKKIESARKLIVKKGLLGMDEGEKKRIVKILERNEIVAAQHEHDAEEERKRNAPVQMSLFDLMQGEEQ